VQVLSLLALALLPPSSNVMRAGTVGAGVGVSMLFSNILSLLARYLLTLPARTHPNPNPNPPPPPPPAPRMGPPPPP